MGQMSNPHPFPRDRPFHGFDSVVSFSLVAMPESATSAAYPFSGIRKRGIQKTRSYLHMQKEFSQR